MSPLSILQLTQSNFVLFCTYAAGLREHFQNIVVVILVSRQIYFLFAYKIYLAAQHKTKESPIFTILTYRRCRVSFRIKFLKCFTHHLLRLIALQVSALLSIPFWQWFLKRFGKKTAAFCGITVSILVSALRRRTCLFVPSCGCAKSKLPQSHKHIFLTSRVNI